MDFVVIGLGLSALALLTGLTLLCMVAPRWSRKSSVAHPADSAYARALAGERQALGQGFLCVGAVLLLATLGGISAGLADKAGAYLIATITTVAVLGLFGWDVLYRRQNPVPQRRRVAAARAKPATAEETTSPAASPTGSSIATTTKVRRRVLPARQRVALPARATTATATDIPLDVEPIAESDGPLDEAHEHVAEAAETPAPSGSEAAPEEESQEPAGQPDVPAEGPSAQEEATEDPVSEEPGDEEPVDVAASRPEPVPFPPTQANGAADQGAAFAPEPGPDILPDGDDRVIALFPTAAARRSRMMTAPTDPDGKN